MIFIHHYKNSIYNTSSDSELAWENLLSIMLNTNMKQYRMQ